MDKLLHFLDNVGSFPRANTITVCTVSAACVKFRTLEARDIRFSTTELWLRSFRKAKHRELLQPEYTKSSTIPDRP